MMDRIAEKLSEWFGSTPFILLHVLWFAVWYPLGGKTDSLTVIVSLEAIFLALFILRAETVQSKRMEEYVKQAKEDVKNDIRLSKRVLKEVEELRYLK